jgi:hypothetical protein
VFLHSIVTTIASRFKSQSPIRPEAKLQDLMMSITKIGDHPVARGGFGEIWKCIYQTDRGPINVRLWCLLYPYKVDIPVGRSEIVTDIHFR